MPPESTPSRQIIKTHHTASKPKLNQTMSLTTYYYEPFFNISDLGHIFDAAWDARRGSGSDVQRREDAISGSFRPKYAHLPSSFLNHSLKLHRMDFHESKEKNEMTATFELPGLKKEDINIDVHNNRLVVSGQSSASTEHDETGYAVRERRYGRFTRAVPLPVGTKTEDIKASMESGVLKVTFPRTQPETEAKKITIS